MLQEINGWHTDQKDEKHPDKPKLLSGFADCKDDGSTACGAWIYSGVFPSYDRNRSRERIRKADDPLAHDWGYAWPMNRRTMYNRCSADADGKPWSEKKKLIWWDAAQKKWVGDDVPDYPPDKAPTYRPAPGAKGMDAIDGRNAFIMKPDGLAWLFSPALKDGPFPTHYEPAESPVPNLLYPLQHDSPGVRYFDGPLNRIDHTPSTAFPVVGCTFRVTEHYLSGPMSRFNSWLNELMPEMFVELSPELAESRGIVHGEWCTVRSARGTVEARAMVTRRLKPLMINGKVTHQIGVPFHWGFAGESTGDVANDLIAMTAEPNVSIQEDKVFSCEVTAGRTFTSNQKPTTSYARWPTTKAAPDTRKSAQAEGQIGNH